jgi:hypothetical protein
MGHTKIRRPASGHEMLSDVQNDVFPPRENLLGGLSTLPHHSKTLHLGIAPAMAASVRRPGFLREAELRLLRCTLPSLDTRAPPLTPAPAPEHPLAAAASTALAAIEAGDYGGALSAAAPHLLPASASTGPPGSAAQFYADLAAAVQAFLLGGGNGEAAAEEHECRCAVVLSAAVAALLAFTQQNVTG